MRVREARLLAGVLAGHFIAFSAHAGDYTRDNFRDIRWLGRGNAGVAVVDDGTALFYNPAGLARTETYGVEILNPVLGANQNFVGSFSELATLTSGSDTLSSKFAPFLGKPLGMQVNVFPHLHVPGFALGLWNYLDASVVYRNPVNPQLDLETRNDYGVIMGSAWGYKKLLSFGASIRYQRRKQLFDSLTAGSILTSNTSLLTSLMRHGNAIAINLGVQARQDFGPQFVALGLAVEDIGTTTFRNTVAQPDLDRQKQQVNLGTAWGFDSPFARVKLLFDLRQLTNTEMDKTKKMQMGVEAGTLFLDARLGFFQGYWTAGLTLQALPFLSIDLASYGEELDVAAGQRYNRYWMLGMRLGADLKPKARKKQRYSLDHL